MRAADLAFDLNEDLRALRRALADRIEADIAVLDMLGGDPDFEADNTVCRRQPDGSLATVGLSSDDEPSLCGIGTHPRASLTLWPGYPRSGGGYGDSAEDIEADAADDEPSLGSLHGTAAGCTFASQASWAAGSRDDREHDAGDDREEENEHGGDIQDEPHDPEEDCDPDAIIDRATPGRYRGTDYRKNELVAEARAGLDAARRRKVKSPAGTRRRMLRLASGLCR